MKDIFQFRDVVPYQLKKQTDFQMQYVDNVFSGTESIINLGNFTSWNKITWQS